MAQVPITARIDFSECNLGVIYPGQIKHRSPFTSKGQTLKRSAGVWRGVARIPIALDEETGREVEAFLAALEGQANWCELPLNKPTPDTAARPRVASQISSKGFLLTRLNSADPDPEYDVGDYLRVGNRLVIVHEQTAARTYRLHPQIVFSAGDIIAPGLTVRAERSSDAENLGPYNPDFNGPWVFDWIEHI